MKDYITYKGKKYKKIDESVDKRITVKEVRIWLKKLEEFRYRKVRNVDARRVTSFINSNLSETDLPNSLQKKWEHAKYSREKHLADKYIKEKISEKWNKLTQEGVEMKNIKLIGIVEELAIREEKPQVNKFEVIEAVKNYQTIGGQLFKNNGIVEVAKQLVGIAESAQNHVLSETDDWFDAVSVKRNMKELKGMTGQFKKAALEANSVNERLNVLYEDMGNILNRYYDIEEAMDPVGKEDDDIDNDGDEDDSDKYLKKRRDAISKNIKKEDVTFAGKKYKKKSDAPISDPLPDRSTKPKPNAKEKRIAGYQKKIQSLQKRRDKMSKDSLKKGIQKTIDGYREIIKKMRS